MFAPIPPAPTGDCERCGKRKATREVCVWIMTDIEWRKWCDHCVDEELEAILQRYKDDVDAVEAIMDMTEELLLGPCSVRDANGNFLPTYGVKYPR